MEKVTGDVTLKDQLCAVLGLSKGASDEAVLSRVNDLADEGFRPAMRAALGLESQRDASNRDLVERATHLHRQEFNRTDVSDRESRIHGIMRGANMTYDAAVETLMHQENAAKQHEDHKKALEKAAAERRALAATRNAQKTQDEERADTTLQAENKAKQQADEKARIANERQQETRQQEADRAADKQQEDKAAADKRQAAKK